MAFQKLLPYFIFLRPIMGKMDFVKSLQFPMENSMGVLSLFEVMNFSQIYQTTGLISATS